MRGLARQAQRLFREHREVRKQRMVHMQFCIEGPSAAFFISASSDLAGSDPAPGRWSSRPSPVRHQAPLYLPLA
jgi:hypothetical protein